MFYKSVKIFLIFSWKIYHVKVISNLIRKYYISYYYIYIYISELVMTYETALYAISVKIKEILCHRLESFKRSTSL